MARARGRARIQPRTRKAGRMRDRPKAAFSDVDRAEDPSSFVNYLDLQHAQPFKRLYKKRTFALLELGPGLRVLEVGCGTGIDALALAEFVAPGGSVVAMDASRTMINEARRRIDGVPLPVSLVQGDVHELGFADDSFDRCRADRTFQHIADPRQALSELIRVTKSGGRLLIIEPDHETLVIDTPYTDVTRRFLQFRSDTLRHGGVAHQLFALFKELGLVDVAVEALTEVSTDYEAINAVMHYDEGIRAAAEHGAVTRREAERWIAYVEQAARLGRFFRSQTYFITTGRKPD